MAKSIATAGLSAEPTAPQYNLKKGIPYILGAALCWSTGGVLVKLIPWNAMAIAGIRSFVALIFSLFVVKDLNIRMTKTNILGGACMFASTFLYILATKLTTAANAIVLQYTAPVFILIISALFLKKRVTRLDICAVAVIFCGISLFFVDNLSGGQLIGNLVALLSGLCFSGLFLCNSAPGATPQQATIVAHILGTITCLPFAFTEVTASFIPWASVIVMGVIQLGLAYFLLSKGSVHTPPLLASLISSIEPVLNPLWVMLIIGERPGFWATIGIAVVILGVVIYNILMGIKSRAAETRERPQPRRLHEAIRAVIRVFSRRAR
ncbi:MAG: EamA family transporter [Clostridia bacterium]